LFLCGVRFYLRRAIPTVSTGVGLSSPLGFRAWCQRCLSSFLQNLPCIRNSSAVSIAGHARCHKLLRRSVSPAALSQPRGDGTQYCRRGYDLGALLGRVGEEEVDNRLPLSTRRSPPAEGLHGPTCGAAAQWGIYCRGSVVPVLECGHLLPLFLRVIWPKAGGERSAPTDDWRLARTAQFGMRCNWPGPHGPHRTHAFGLRLNDQLATGEGNFPAQGTRSAPLGGRLILGLELAVGCGLG
jgi:hypothetical protein